MRHQLLRLAAATLLALPALAQTPLIVPEALLGIEGGSSSVIPFGLRDPVRYQCVYDADQLPFSGARLISEIRFRADWNGGNPIPAKQFLRMDVTVSTSTRLAADASPNFAENHGVDRQMVARNVQIVLPAQAAQPAGGPRAADVSIPFDNPYMWGLSPIRGATVPTSLVIELQIRSQPPGTYRLDSPFTCDSQVQVFPAQPAPCLTSAGNEIQIASSDDIRAGGTVMWTVTDMIADAPFAVLLWIDTTGDWIDFDPVTGAPLPQIVPLPAPLHPFAPGCTLRIRPDQVQLAGTADSNGLGRASLLLPADRSLVGQTFFAQAIARDIAANAFGHTVSRGVRSTVCGPLGCARIYAIGDANAVTGSVTFGAASILEVR